MTDGDKPGLENYLAQQVPRDNKGVIMSTEGVRLTVQSDYVTVDNGILEVTLSNPDGNITNIKYNGIDNLLEDGNDEDNRGFVMLKGSSGFYCYAIYECLEGWPEFNIYETRIVFKLAIDKFLYMAIADNRQRVMPLLEDREVPEHSEKLAYPEAVRFTNPNDPNLIGEVDDKYQYSMENKDNQVHGWICTEDQPTGFWQITPSNEFRTCGPIKQDLTSHVGPITLAMFVSTHYAGEDVYLKFRDGESWKKVFGPIFIYVNSVPQGDDATLSLWEDAKTQMMTEVQSWPYSFPESVEFQKSEERGNILGRLLVLDRYVKEDYIPAKDACVGLAPPGDAGSWQTECKGYQFWTTADEDGYFSIYNVRTGDYNLYAWVPGFIGDYLYENIVTIASGSSNEYVDLVYEPPRVGPTLWEIGIPDRSAAEFYVPDPDPMYINSLYVNHPDRFRQYGLWSRYADADLYPSEDLVYTVGVCDYTTDWFFAQVTRKIDVGNEDNDDDTYVGTTWQIRFEDQNIDVSGTYTLRVAIASATLAELQVRVNDPDATEPLYSSGLIGRDNAVARHGIRGLHSLHSISIDGSLLIKGVNTIFLTQPRNDDEFRSFMYDYLRFEGPPNWSLFL
ncbi:probable rhamnogalacturonate lyase B isoform X1 [Ziziphus jujuba]|uniref:rhamnogalacturonan endolyase n=2 Tax=Ziziphus jujuba TaxID=326968 RepID=A0ABM4A8G0_ZIZJJ|nr:probable rhamnogalacturonate lyase B isoform X1 [Ziziphus jujuba]